jgi:quercetin dioxygenase-like cupin family protein
MKDRGGESDPAASLYRVDFQAIPWQSPMKGMRFKACLHRGRRLRLVEYTPGMETHWCEQGHIGYVLAGQLEVSFPDETRVYGPGDGIFIPNGVEHRHAGRALTDVVRVVFVEDVE